MPGRPVLLGRARRLRGHVLWGYGVRPVQRVRDALKDAETDDSTQEGSGLFFIRAGIAYGGNWARKWLRK
jgi:hypothetical protein